MGLRIIAAGFRKFARNTGLSADQRSARASRGEASRALSTGNANPACPKTPLVLACGDLQGTGKAVFLGIFRYLARRGIFESLGLPAGLEPAASRLRPHCCVSLGGTGCEPSARLPP